ncbi:MAG TPA: AtpZ/AtpI family protein [Phycisphaerales bacterium]|jgi:ATP synthase protein I|nr:AtpZ/AtpI family protein [Phycisphaerales bacterium]
MAPPPPIPEASPRTITEAVARKAERKARARRKAENQMWVGFGMFGLIGWSVAVPTLIGVALGVWLDRVSPRPGFSWTLALLLAGVGIGCLNAWYWVKREQRAIEREGRDDE